MTQAAREEMLSTIKAALKGEVPRKSFSPSSGAPDEIRARCNARRDSLTEQFSAELTRVGGHLFRAASLAEASEYVERLAVSTGAQRVVGWDSPVVGNIARSDSLKRAGVEFLCDRAREREGEDGFISAAVRSDIGITAVDYALADTGTLVLISGRGRARVASLLPPVHVAVVEPRQIISGLDDLFPLLEEDGIGRGGDLPSAVTFITGPSRTADIELTLVVGVHGPQQLHVILLTESEAEPE